MMEILIKQTHNVLILKNNILNCNKVTCQCYFVSTFCFYTLTFSNPRFTNWVSRTHVWKMYLLRSEDKPYRWQHLQATSVIQCMHVIHGHDRTYDGTQQQ